VIRSRLQDILPVETLETGDSCGMQSGIMGKATFDGLFARNPESRLHWPSIDGQGAGQRAKA